MIGQTLQAAVEQVATGPGPAPYGALWDAAATLLVAVALMVVVARFARGGLLPRRRARQSRLELVETLPLGGRRAVHVLRLDGEHELLVGASDAGVALLARSPDRRHGRVDRVREDER